ncbi:hypothetical protein [Peristeroidobacter soli]|uniref:hypothetical protein n=1 Tax=Peristeroidobacter soli TaxID=2497877 RepID=UPI00101C267F|nr:hypothetical protein [Peristeroidobacter soli]
MKLSSADERYMEERALAIALAMASTAEEQARIDRLVMLRAALMTHRQAQSTQAAELGRSREELDASVKQLYMAQGTSEDVLRVHARTCFVREMQAHEVSFARAWIDAIGDPDFADQLRLTTTTTTSSWPPRTDDRNR